MIFRGRTRIDGAPGSAPSPRGSAARRRAAESAVAGRAGCPSGAALSLGALRRGRVRAGLALLCGLAAGGVPCAGAQEVRGLVIGINEYVELRPLGGAVNDARDLARALSGAGVQDIVLLEDAAATRARIEAEWQALVERSAPGDTLVLTYAGHGGQEQARFPESEEDGKDETLLLGGFRDTGEGTRERIVDDELNQWFVEAGARDLEVIFVADSCHSGSVTRSADPRAPAGVSRQARYTIGDDMLQLDVDPGIATLRRKDLPHVSFLAAGQENQEITEIPLRNERGVPELRGALSYFFARALEGDADWDADGVLRRDELWRFVRENVRMRSDTHQIPNLEPESDDEVLLRLAPAPRTSPSGGAASGTSGSLLVAGESGGGSTGGESAGSPAAATATLAPHADALAGAAGGSGDAGVFSDVPALRLSVINADPAALAGVRDSVQGIRLVSATDAPDLLWDAAALEVVSGLGDVAAYGVDLATLQSVVDKWRAVQVIEDLSSRTSLALRLIPDAGVHRAGSIYGVEVGGLRHPRLILFMLSAKGRVHYLSEPGDASRIAPDRPFPVKLRVTEPFGVDHLVAVSAASPLGRLDVALERLEGRRAARRVAELLVSASAGAEDWWSGVQGLYSIP